MDSSSTLPPPPLLFHPVLTTSPELSSSSPTLPHVKDDPMGQVGSSDPTLQTLAVLQSQLQDAATRPRSGSAASDREGEPTDSRRDRSSSLNSAWWTGASSSEKGKEKAEDNKEVPTSLGPQSGSDATRRASWYNQSSLAFPSTPLRAHSAPGSSSSSGSLLPLPSVFPPLSTPRVSPRPSGMLLAIPSSPSSATLPPSSATLPPSPLLSPLPINESSTSPAFVFTSSLDLPPSVSPVRAWQAPSLYSRPDISTSVPNLGLGLVMDSATEAAGADGIVRRTSEQGATYGVQAAEKNSPGEKAEKRYHALKELVETEAAYLESLRTLVHVYFQTLPFLGVLSPTDLSTIVRTANQLLELHERIASRIEIVGNGLKWESTPEREEVVRMAAGRIAGIFLDELPNFSLYQEFCARHGEALDLIRGLESQPEWEAYERQCSSLVSLRRHSRTHSSSHAQSTSTISSTSDATYRITDEQGDITPVAAVIAEDPFFTPPPLPNTSRTNTKSTLNKLRFQDYAIQPIQRICRYPLVFGQVLKHLGECVERGAVKKTWDGVRQAAGGVDDAKRVREAELRTKIVANRMEFQSPVNLAFCDLLGGTLLVGTLHTLHRFAGQEPPRVRYLGCFLYHTHLVMVKVRKRDSYEPREWLPLRLFEIVDLTEGEGVLPHAIRLSNRDHQFELGATCAPEKVIWLSKLSSVQVEARRQWDKQPRDDSGAPTLFDDTLISSTTPITRSHTRSDSAPPRISASSSPTFPLDGSPFFEDPSQLPIELESPSLPTPSGLPSSTSATFISRPNRFSATASSLLGRTPANQRAAIDLRLADVFSAECLSARAQSARQEGRTTFTGGNSTSKALRQRTLSSGAKISLGVAQSVNKLSTREKEKRRMSCFDLGTGKEADFRGAVGYDASSSQVYRDEVSDKKWLAALRKAKANGTASTMSATTSFSRRPILPNIDMSKLHDVQGRSNGDTWKNRTMSLRRAASHSSLERISPSSQTFSPQPSPTVSVDVERNNSVSSTASSAGTGAESSFSHHASGTETPPSSPDIGIEHKTLRARLPITAKYSQPENTILRRRGSQPALNGEGGSSEQSGGAKLRRGSTLGGFFSKRVQSSPMLSSYFQSNSNASTSTPHLPLPTSPDDSPTSTASSSPGTSMATLPSSSSTGLTSPERKLPTQSLAVVENSFKKIKSSRFMFHQHHKLSPLT